MITNDFLPIDEYSTVAWREIRAKNQEIADDLQLPEEWNEAARSKIDEQSKDYTDTQKKNAMRFFEVVRNIAEVRRNPGKVRCDVMPELQGVFFDSNGMPYAELTICGHTENWPIRGRYFQTLYTKSYYLKEGRAPTDTAIKQAVALFCALAHISNRRCETHLRCGRTGDTIYIDQCNDNWQVIEVSENGINLLNKSPISFIRHGHMLPLNVDLKADEKDINLIFKYIYCKDESDKRLLRANIVCSFVPDVAHTILTFYGPKGSGKSTSHAIVRGTIDPSGMGVLALPSTVTETMQMCLKHYLCFFDNISYLRKDMSDFLCRLVYGNSFSKRELYTDTEDVVLQMRRVVGLNGINLPGEEPDLLDRSLEIALMRIPPDQRRSEKKLWADFAKDQPKITGAALKILQKALSIKEELDVKELPRMADFALLGEAASRAMGEVPDVFLNDYWQKIEGLNTSAIESHPIGLTILELMRECITKECGHKCSECIIKKEREVWSGTPSELLDALTAIADKLKINTKYGAWPTAPNALSRKLNEVSDNLKEEGIEVTSSRSGNGRKFIIKKVGKNRHNSHTVTKQEYEPSKNNDDKSGSDDTHIGINDDNVDNVSAEDNIKPAHSDDCDDNDDISKESKEKVVDRRERIAALLGWLGTEEKPKLEAEEKFGAKIVADCMRDGITYEPHSGQIKAI